jgi:hypothetical protein
MREEQAGEALTRQFGDDLTDLVPIGRGGTGVVYRGRQRRLGRPVVVKIHDPIVLDCADRALSEARAQAAISWHSNVLTILGEGVTTSGRPYLLLEDAEGGTLYERVENEGACSEAEAVSVAAQLASALIAAHEAAIVHCDVKPSNVLFSRDGTVLLSDFGAANTSRTATLDFVQGSLLFAPPELLEGKTPDAPNDVYGMAVTLYYALTGEPPFGGVDQPSAATIARIHTDRLSFDDLGLASWFAALLNRCVSREPTERPSAHEVLAEINRHCAHGVDLPAALETDVAVVAERMIRDRRKVIEDLYRFLAEEHSAVQTVRALLFDLSLASAEAALPLQRLASRRCPDLGGRCPALDEMRRLVLAELLTHMSGGKELLWQGVGEFRTVIAPVDMQQPAKDYNAAIRWAQQEAPEVNWSMGPGYDERVWLLLGRISDGRFLDELFSDPDSYDLFDAETVALMLTVAMPLFEALVENHWDWVYELLHRRPDLRRMIAYEFPVMLLRGVARAPEGVVTPDWRDELEVGVLRLPGWERSAMRNEFGESLKAVGVEL